MLNECKSKNETRYIGNEETRKPKQSSVSLNTLINANMGGWSPRSDLLLWPDSKRGGWRVREQMDSEEEEVQLSHSGTAHPREIWHVLNLFWNNQTTTRTKTLSRRTHSQINYTINSTKSWIAMQAARTPGMGADNCKPDKKKESDSQNTRQNKSLQLTRGWVRISAACVWRSDVLRHSRGYMSKQQSWMKSGTSTSVWKTKHVARTNGN